MDDISHRMTERFRDDRTHLSEFADEFLVECPRCGRCAVVRRREPAAGSYYRAVLACGGCGHSAEQATDRVVIGGAEDWYFGLPLWLRVACCGETLWAYNRRHLAFLETYLGALLRPHSRHARHGWSNKSVASRLPTWMKLAKNRAAVLSCIAWLRDVRLAAPAS